MNVHGAWQPKSKKKDTPERIVQSNRLRDFTKGKEERSILIGDFNLNPDTRSVSILEEKYENLITRYGISSTRTAAYDDPSLPFADYAFTGRAIAVTDFRVLLESIYSDHGCLFLSVRLPL